MRGYYVGRLSGERLRRCYEVAPPRVRQYLEAEILHVTERLDPDDLVLELGCGYGRVAGRLARRARRVVGIDTAIDGLLLARRLYGAASRCDFLAMDALRLAFAAGAFDHVVCVQNGICAFGVDQEQLVRQALRVTRPGGRVWFSTYAQRFWDDRLAWFEAQAAEGLLGPIDYDRTGDGTIACKDGFRSGLVTPEGWRSLGDRLGVDAEIVEVDRSSLWCEFSVERER